jgi:hypothetical protein
MDTGIATRTRGSCTMMLEMMAWRAVATFEITSAAKTSPMAIASSTTLMEDRTRSVWSSIFGLVLHLKSWIELGRVCIKSLRRWPTVLARLRESALSRR